MFRSLYSGLNKLLQSPVELNQDPFTHYLITILTVLMNHILTIYLICYYYFLTIFNLFGQYYIYIELFFIYF
jgi:type III secretory pathway component EscU